MLMISRQLWLVAALAAVTALVGGVATALTLGRPADDDAATAIAGLVVQPEAPPVCPPGQRDCSVEGEEGGEEGGQEGGGDSGSGAGGDGRCYFNGGGGGPITVADSRPGPTTVLIAQNRVEVPCSLPGRGWYDGSGCYYGPPAFNFDTTPPDGASEDDGQWYQVHCLIGVDGDNLFFDALLRHEWVEFGDIPTVTPEELVQRAIARIGLDGVEFQLAPPVTGTGVVNMPVWLGVNEDPDTNWGLIEDSECEGTLCVAISASVTSVAWNMGDGNEFTCEREDHVTWEPGMNFLAPPSGSCHHYYRRDGLFEITATSTWTVNWEVTSGGGEADFVETDRTSTTSLQINEIQVLTR